MRLSLESDENKHQIKLSMINRSKTRMRVQETNTTMHHQPNTSKENQKSEIILQEPKQESDHAQTDLDRSDHYQKPK